MKKTKVEVPIEALSYAAAAAMTRAEAVTRFQVEASAGQRAFSAMGKLFRCIEASLTKKDKGIFPLLQKAGIPKGSISNASYAAKVFSLVEAGHLTEAEYDRLSHADCFNIVRVQTARSAKQLTAEEVVAVVKVAGEPDEELASLYETGLTLDEAKAKQDAADKVKAAAEAAATAKAEAEAVEIEKIKAENADLKAKAAKQSDPEIEDAKAGHPAPASTDEDETEEETIEAPEGVTLAGVLDAINAVELAFSELDEDSQAVVTARIAELAEAVGVNLGGKKKKVVAA
jgi:hypothetical protein